MFVECFLFMLVFFGVLVEVDFGVVGGGGGGGSEGVY